MSRVGSIVVQESPMSAHATTKAGRDGANKIASKWVLEGQRYSQFWPGDHQINGEVDRGFLEFGQS